VIHVDLNKSVDVQQNNNVNECIITIHGTLSTGFFVETAMDDVGHTTNIMLRVYIMQDPDRFPNEVHHL